MLLTLAGILLLSIFSGEIRDTDIWLHLKTGQHTLETRALTVPDPFSYTSGMGGARYPGEEVTRYFNLTHEWLAQIVMYLIYLVAGFPGLVLARAALLIVFCALVGWIAYRRTAGFYISLAAALAAAGVAVHFQQSRPFLVTFVCLAITMAILEFWQAKPPAPPGPPSSQTIGASQIISGGRLGWGRRFRLPIESGCWWWLLPPLFLIWANCHAGFFMGWLMIGAYCGEALIQRLRKKPVSNERRLWLVAIACLLVSALNPNGFRVIKVLFLYRSSGIQSTILEWQRPKFWEPGVYSFLLFGSLLTLLLARRRTRPVDWLLYFGFAVISLMAIRNAIFMGLVGPVIMAAYLPKWRAVPVTAVLLATAALIVSALAPAIATGNIFALRSAEWQLPVGAAGFIQSHRITDRMFNPYETGGYLVWRLWPMQRDFIDPRGLSEAAYADYGRILNNTDTDKLIQKYGMQMLVLEGFDYLSGQVYPLAGELANSRQTEWKLVYSDSQGFIFMRHPPPSVQPLDSRETLLQSLEAQCNQHMRHDPSRPRCARGLGEFYAALDNPAPARQWMSTYLEHRTEPDPEAEQIYQSMNVTALNDEALSLESKGDLAAAEPLFRQAVAIAEKSLGPNHPDTAGSLNNLASLLESKGDYAAAEPLYGRALAIVETTLGPGDPRTAAALDNLAGLFEAEGNYAAAEPLYRRALSIAEKALGADHSTTQSIKEDLDGLLERRAAKF